MATRNLPRSDRERGFKRWTSRSPVPSIAISATERPALSFSHTSFSHTLAGTRHVFSDLRSLLACASPARSGDQLAGLAAASAADRAAAQYALAALPLADIVNQPVIPYEDDEVTRLILDSHDPASFAVVSSLTVGAFREFLLE